MGEGYAPSLSQLSENLQTIFQLQPCLCKPTSNIQYFSSNGFNFQTGAIWPLFTLFCSPGHKIYFSCSLKGHIFGHFWHNAN